MSAQPALLPVKLLSQIQKHERAVSTPVELKPADALGILHCSNSVVPVGCHFAPFVISIVFCFNTAGERLKAAIRRGSLLKEVKPIEVDECKFCAAPMCTTSCLVPLPPPFQVHIWRLSVDLVSCGLPGRSARPILPSLCDIWCGGREWSGNGSPGFLPPL